MRKQSIAALFIVFSGLSVGFALLKSKCQTQNPEATKLSEAHSQSDFLSSFGSCGFEGQSLDIRGGLKPYNVRVHFSLKAEALIPESLEFPDGTKAALFPSSAGPLGGERYTATEKQGRHISVHLFNPQERRSTQHIPFMALTDDDIPADGSGTFFTTTPQPRLLTPKSCHDHDNQKLEITINQLQADQFQARQAWQLAQTNLQSSRDFCTEVDRENFCFHSLSLPLSDSRFNAAYTKMKGLNPSWGCPADRNDLSYLWLAHWTPLGQIGIGELLIESDAADEIISVFGEIFAAKYPIERMRPQDWFEGRDEISMAANNTSGFRCPASDQGGEHPKGSAVDINPLINPFIRPNEVELNPESGRENPPPQSLVEALSQYEIEPREAWELSFIANREKHIGRNSDIARMLITGDSAPVKAFTRIGWIWGGHWKCCSDYQHFSENGY